jgi:hypothetical protein
MHLYCESINEYKRLKTVEVNVGGLLLGSDHPIRIQTMTTTDTMDTMQPWSKAYDALRQEQNWFASRPQASARQKIY